MAMPPVERIQNGQDFLRALWADSGKERVMLRYCHEDVVREETISGLFNEVRTYAAKLSAMGLTEGRIGILGPNCREWLAAFLALFRLGATAVLLNSQEPPEVLGQDIAQTELRAVLYHPCCRTALERSGASEGLLCVPFPVWGTERTQNVTVRENQSGPEDPACIFFTSGTDSRKKAVVHTNRSLLASVCNNIVGRPFQIQLISLPLCHLAGLCGVCNAWYLGATVALGTDMKYFFRYLEQFQPDFLTVVPMMLPILVRRLRNATLHGASLGWNLHMINCGGATFPPQTLELLLDRGIVVLNSYGATETGGIGFTCPLEPSRPDTVGKTLNGVEASIVDGDLLLRTPSMMQGYYGDPDATGLVMRDGWYCTGDGAWQDEEGYFYIAGRKDSLIVRSSGENINPERLETRLNTLELVRESLVTEERGQLTAVIVLEKEAEEAAEQQVSDGIDALNAALPTYERIGAVRFQRTPLPRNAMGKLLRGRMK